MRIGRYEITANKVIILLAGFIVIFNLYCLIWYPPSPYLYRGTFMLVFTIMAPLLAPPKSKIGKVLIAILTLMALFGILYPMIFEAKLTAQNYTATSTEVIVFIIFFIGIGGVLTRVPAGSIMLGIIVAGLLYFTLGHYIPGYFGHGKWPLTYIVTHAYTDLDLGVFGSFTYLACRLIAIFMVFAALLMQAGLGDVFIALSQWLAGNATGGPAKVSVFSSAAFGMISGSAIANVVATGAFTIPLMKRVGYEPRMAATVESLASPGGSLMPPIMGISAFLMADILGIPYLKVCIAALIPVFLWYFTVYCIVHYYALRHRIGKWRPPREELIAVLKAKSHLIVSILILVAAMVYTGSAEQAGLFGVASLLLLTFVRKETRLTKNRIAAFLKTYAEMFAPLFVLMIGLGIFIAGLMASGVHIKIGQVLMGGIEQWYFLLLLTFVLVLVLGMVVPIAAAYVGAVVVVAPILAQTGIPLLVIHMFVFFACVLAPITPPTAAAVFAAARIAGADMMPTAIYAMLKSIPLWIVPFSMYKHSLILGVGTPLSVLLVEVTILCIGIIVFVMGVEGYSNHRLKMFERVLMVVIGLITVQPIAPLLSKIFAGIGIVLLIYWAVARFFEKRRQVA